MSYISSLNPSVQGYQGLQASDERTQSKYASINKESMSAIESKNLNLNITTKEGDVVTLSKESFMDFSSLSYDKSGGISSGNEKAAINVSSRSMTLASGTSFTFSVQGSLSESELNDIESLVGSLDEIMYEMASGKMDDAFDMALGMDEFDSFSQYFADLNYSSTFNYEQQSAWSSNRQYDEGISGFSVFEGLAGKEADSSNMLLEMMLESMDKLAEKENIMPRKIQEPVDQLFSHHINELKTNNDEKEPKNDMIQLFEQAKQGMKDNFNRIMQNMSPNLRSFRSYI